MPLAPLRQCAQLGCNELVRTGRCDKHKRTTDQRTFDRQRGNSAERGYDATWRKFREWFLSRHPVCERGADRDKVLADIDQPYPCGRPAEHVHHVSRLQDGGPRLDERNCQALCETDHNSLRGAGGWA